ncbi:MAG: hypothetical protein ACREJ9_13060 [Candidatus Rokuibacteriota bacterium]
MNVYYLPTRIPSGPEPIVSEWPSFPTRLRNAWWRVRLAMVEVRGILRSRPRYMGGVLAYEPLAEDEPLVPTRRPSRPATVIELEAARRRLRRDSQS